MSSACVPGLWLTRARTQGRQRPGTHIGRMPVSEMERSGIEQHCEVQMREFREAESSGTAKGKYIAKRNLQENQEGQRICR